MGAFECGRSPPGFSRTDRRLLSVVSTSWHKNGGQLHLGADFKNNQTIFIWTNRKVESKLYLLPIGPDRIVYLFGCLIVFKIRSQDFLSGRATKSGGVGPLNHKEKGSKKITKMSRGWGSKIYLCVCVCVCFPLCNFIFKYLL